MNPMSVPSLFVCLLGLTAASRLLGHVGRKHIPFLLAWVFGAVVGIDVEHHVPAGQDESIAFMVSVGLLDVIALSLVKRDYETLCAVHPKNLYGTIWAKRGPYSYEEPPAWEAE